MSELLHLSEKTVDKLLRGERVDRGTVKLAFQKLGIEWDEAFIEIESDVEAPADEHPIEAPVSRPRRTVVAIAAALLTVASVGWIGAKQLSGPEQERPASWRVEFFSRLEAGTKLYQRASYDQARTEFAAVHALATRHDDLAGQAESARMTADVDLAQGHLVRARNGYQIALELRERTGQSATYPALQQALGAAELKLKNLDVAKGWMRKALEGYVALNDGSGMAIVQRDLGSLSAAQGDHEGALAWFATARAGVGRGVNTALLMDVRAQEALVHLARGEVKKADQMLTDCLEYWEREAHPRWVARTKLQLSEVKAAAGEQQLANRLRAESASAFRQIGDRVGAAEAEEPSTQQS